MENRSFNIISFFEESAREFPERSAIIEANREISFGELAKEIEITASYFQQKGIKKNDRVLVFVPMGIDLYRIVLALFKIGATAVFLDEWVSFKRLNLCCKIAECKAFIGIFKARVLTLFSSEIRKISIKLGTTYTKSDRKPQAINTTNEDTALITFTTGSSGTPKAAKRTHGFLKAQFEVLEKKLDLSVSKVDMPVLPIVLMINLGKGISSVIADFKASKPNSLKPQKILSQIEKHGVQSIASSPFFIKKLGQYAKENKIEIIAIKRIFTGGAAVFPDEAQLYNQSFPKANTTILYGSTEAEPISGVDSHKLADCKIAEDKGLFVGEIDEAATVSIIPISSSIIEIGSKDQLHKISLADGETGEILVTGDHVLKEYINNPEATARQKIWIEGSCWHRTGDSGFKIGKDLYLTGPCDALIKKDGKILSPFLFEHILSAINGIASGTIIELENKTHAIIECVPSAKKIDIKKKALELEGIDQINFIKKIPKDPRHQSKIEYKSLQKMMIKKG